MLCHLVPLCMSAAIMQCMCTNISIVQEMTLEEFEKIREEQRKALLALKTEERKVEVDKELQSMQQLSVKKDAEEVFIKLVSYTCCGPSSACGYIDANFYPTPCCRALTRRRRKKTQKERSVPRRYPAHFSHVLLLWSEQLLYLLLTVALCFM